MDKKSEIRRLWTESFRDTPQFVEMFFTRVYDDRQGMLLEEDGEAVSSLVLQQYPFLMHGEELTAAYVSGAATRRSARGKGYMSRLMVDALRESYRRGDAVCALIPAHRWLYFFYDRFGFSTVFYVDKQRFTSLHAFSGEGVYEEVEDVFGADVYEAMRRFERERGCGVMHTRRDFLNVMDDVALDDSARFVALKNDKGKIAAMAWAVSGHDQVEVRELLGEDDNARLAALRALRKQFPNTHFTVLAPAGNKANNLFARGMGRIVNVRKVLEACAGADVKWRSVIRVSDPIIEENNRTFAVGDGEVREVEGGAKRLDLDVDVEVLNRIVFSRGEVGGVVGVPSSRPHMALMLE